jgi:lipopolysaccharide export LptBFGC system permease protein LptF
MLPSLFAVSELNAPVMTSDEHKMTGDEYKKEFGLSEPPSEPPNTKRAKNALTLALEIRKFEIELYWKRATYFWAFLAVLLGAYFALLAAKEPFEERGEALVTVSCLGIIFSTAWYFVNRASKFWQENWESHVDLLEDAENGPLYKTVLKDKHLSFWKLNSPYNFSVSKLNQLLSFIVIILFVVLLVRTLLHYYKLASSLDPFANIALALTVLAIGALWTYGRTRPMGTKEVQAEKRETKIL